MSKSWKERLSNIALTVAFQWPIAAWAFSAHGWAFVWFIAGLSFVVSIILFVMEDRAPR